MRARRFLDADADLTALADRQVAVIGYGNQGSAQAQNLRDSGIEVVIGNRADDYRARASADGFDVVDIAEATRRAQVVLLLIPDEVQPEVVSQHVAPGLTGGDTLVVASGYNLAFGLLTLPERVDLVMVAPRMIGAAVRERYRQGKGYPCFVSVEHDASGTALATALAVARGIGATASGAVASSAREEAALDLFSEQAIWPAIIGILESSYRILSAAGFSDDAILDELYLSGEPAEVLAKAAQLGLVKQLRVHSHTSQYGQLTNLQRQTDLIDTIERRFSEVLHDQILSGRFAEDWSSPAARSEQRLDELHEQAAGDPLILAEQSIISARPQQPTQQTSQSVDDSVGERRAP